MADLFAGVDLGGTKIAAALGTASGEVAASGVIETRGSDGAEAALKRTAELLERLAGECGAQPLAIGMGLPGLLDIAAGTALFLPNLPGHWTGVPVARILGAETGKSVYVLNDARMATMGEHTFGAARASATLLMVTIGTGIGGGLVLDGELYLGRLGATGEVGHQTILPEGPRCTCGNRGCLETLASGTALAAEGAALMGQGLAPRLKALAGDGPVTARLMGEAAGAGDTHVAAAIEKAATYLGIGIANAITVTGVERVVLTGGVATLGELLLGPIRAAIPQRVRMFPSAHIEVTCSSLGDQAGVLGAIAWAAHKHLQG
jgi:glucokinase